MENDNEKPSYVLKFNEKFIRPKNESVTKDIIKGIVTLAIAVLLVLWIVLGREFRNEIPVSVWAGLFLMIVYLVTQGGHEDYPSPCELWFYDDYIVQYCEKRYYDKRQVRKEYYKFYYKDIHHCYYRTVSQKIAIYGMVEMTFYKYDKNGNVAEVPSLHKTIDSISTFYTVFEPSIDFVKEIEVHSPMKVEIQST